MINDATHRRAPFGKQFQTTGLGSPKEASELALLLKGGALAAPVDIVDEGVIGASLGQDNIDKGFKAVLLGLALVLLAAAIYYKLFGLVADIALFFNLVILVAVMSLIGVTLTMPGIAGIVLTLGMAIDANVLICERIREELRNGSTPHASIRAGYEKAWATILDANVTHLIAALALTTMGSGADQGLRRHADDRHPDLDVHLGDGDPRDHRADPRPPQAQDAVGVRARNFMEIFNHNTNVPSLACASSASARRAADGRLDRADRHQGPELRRWTSPVASRWRSTTTQPTDVGQVRAALAEGRPREPVVQSLGGTRQMSIRLQPKDDTTDCRQPDRQASSSTAVADDVSQRRAGRAQGRAPAEEATSFVSAAGRRRAEERRQRRGDLRDPRHHGLTCGSASSAASRSPRWRPKCTTCW